MKTARWGAIALAACYFGAPAAQAAGDPQAGHTKAYTCFGCHGVVGYTNAYPMYRVPRIGGQNADYIVAALQDYKTGARPHPTMRMQAGTLSDQDMQDIAAYFSKAPAQSE